MPEQVKRDYYEVLSVTRNASGDEIKSAYRKAAVTVAEYDGDVAGLASQDGLDALDALPAVGPSIAHAIQEMVDTGRWAQLERLRGALDPAHAVDRFGHCTVSGDEIFRSFAELVAWQETGIRPTD